MKKLVFVIVLAVATFAAVGVSAQTVDDWYITASEGGARIRNNQVTLRKGENYIYIYFRDSMMGTDFGKMRLNFTITQPLEVVWQAAYGPSALVMGSTQPAGTIDKGPIETDFASFTLRWSGRGDLDKKTMNGMVLMVNGPASGTATFNMTEVTKIP